MVEQWNTREWNSGTSDGGLVSLVSLVSELHNYSTRSASSNQVAIPLFRTNLRRFCPSIIGSFFWNDIPQSIRDKPSKKMFKKALLRWYLAQY